MKTDGGDGAGDNNDDDYDKTEFCTFARTHPQKETVNIQVTI